MSPKKKTATVPGPQCEAIIVPISHMRISPEIFLKRSSMADFVASASSRQLEWQIQHFPE